VEKEKCAFLTDNTKSQGCYINHY